MRSAHQIYPDADHKDGFVTARKLTRLASFHANNIDKLIKGEIEPEALESNASIFDRYVQSLPSAYRQRAEGFRLAVAGKPAMHRAKGAVIHDPTHTLFLVPGAGPHPGLPGNYLHGSLFQLSADAQSSRWAVHVHDSDDGSAAFESSSRAESLVKLMEVIESAPFRLDEMESLGFKLDL